MNPLQGNADSSRSTADADFTEATLHPPNIAQPSSPAVLSANSPPTPTNSNPFAQKPAPTTSLNAYHNPFNESGRDGNPFEEFDNHLNIPAGAPIPLTETNFSAKKYDSFYPGSTDDIEPPGGVNTKGPPAHITAIPARYLTRYRQLEDDLQGTSTTMRYDPTNDMHPQTHHHFFSRNYINSTIADMRKNKRARVMICLCIGFVVFLTLIGVIVAAIARSLSGNTNVALSIDISMPKAAVLSARSGESMWTLILAAAVGGQEVRVERLGGQGFYSKVEEGELRTSGLQRGIWLASDSAEIVFTEQERAKAKLPSLFSPSIASSCVSVASSPIGIAMLRTTAQQLIPGWPNASLSWTELFNLAKNGSGTFSMAYANPGYSTTGRLAVLAVTYGLAGVDPYTTAVGQLPTAAINKFDEFDDFVLKSGVDGLELLESLANVNAPANFKAVITTEQNVIYLNQRATSPNKIAFVYVSDWTYVLDYPLCVITNPRLYPEGVAPTNYLTTAATLQTYLRTQSVQTAQFVSAGFRPAKDLIAQQSPGWYLVSNNPFTSENGVRANVNITTRTVFNSTDPPTPTTAVSSSKTATTTATATSAPPQASDLVKITELPLDASTFVSHTSAILDARTPPRVCFVIDTNFQTSNLLLPMALESMEKYLPNMQVGTQLTVVWTNQTGTEKLVSTTIKGSGDSDAPAAQKALRDAINNLGAGYRANNTMNGSSFVFRALRTCLQTVIGSGVNTTNSTTTPTTARARMIVGALTEGRDPEITTKFGNGALFTTGLLDGLGTTAGTDSVPRVYPMWVHWSQNSEEGAFSIRGLFQEMSDRTGGEFDWVRDTGTGMDGAIADSLSRFVAAAGGV
ncbi:hypothetical protein BJ742DRAFT_835707 [Cladochytrium replicatum]|nr:hypothetical protein BJ742DRAFT_835707 [Cladochytrium replicatum]